jgi:hypothetical protein
MMINVLLLAAVLHRPPALVDAVYRSSPWAPTLAVAVVECESSFNPLSLVVDAVTGITYWGLWQISSKWWPQWRDCLPCHVNQGSTILLAALCRARGDYAKALSIYSSGHPGHKAYSRKVMGVYGRLTKALIRGE